MEVIIVEKLDNAKFVLKHRGKAYGFETWAELRKRLDDILNGGASRE